MAATLKGIEIVGVDVHIGSQITDLEPFEAAFRRVGELVRILRADGHAITRLDLGGGLGVPYDRRQSAAARSRRLWRDGDAGDAAIWAAA